MTTRGFDQKSSTGMWRVVFYERRGLRIETDRTGPWLPTRELAKQWAAWFNAHGHHVALEDQVGNLEKLSMGLPT